MGEWYYPNGSVISADSAREGLYVMREQMSVSLNHRSGSEQTVTAGLYCCGLSSSQGTLYSCIMLGKCSRKVNIFFIFIICLNLDSPQDVPTSPQCTRDVSGPVIGSVVAIVTVLLIVVGVVTVIITYLILRHKRGGSM